MRRLFRLVVFVPLVVLFIGVADVSDVYACSGGGTITLESLLERVDYVVKAQPVEIDTIRQNAILQVESVLVGEPLPEHIMFVQNESYIAEGILSHWFSGVCLTFGQEIPTATPSYFLIARHPDGSYRGVAHLTHFTFPNNDEPTNLSIQGRYFESLEVTESEFIALIADLSNDIPVSPTPDTPYPLYSNLLIETQAGTRYLLPVDGRPPIIVDEDLIDSMQQDLFESETIWDEGYWETAPCIGNNCDTISPNNVFRAEQNNDIIFIGAETYEGQALLFSSTNDAIAVWNDTNIIIHIIGSPIYTLDFTRTIPLNINENTNVADFYTRASWSPDGRTLAYSDSDGLWLVDVYSLSSDPVLLIPTTDDIVPFARYYSPMGRYLAISEGDNLTNLDLATGERLPDGIISPNDRLLLTYATIDGNPVTQLHALISPDTAPFTTTASISNDDGNTTIYATPLQIEWIDSYTFIGTLCEFGNQTSCVVTICDVTAQQFSRCNDVISPAYQFAVDEDSGLIAMLQDNNTIMIDDNVYNLANQLDGDIVGIEWMPSLFYYR